jgi:hypothetical protein
MVAAGPAQRQRDTLVWPGAWHKRTRRLDEAPGRAAALRRAMAVHGNRRSAQSPSSFTNRSEPSL